MNKNKIKYNLNKIKALHRILLNNIQRKNLLYIDKHEECIRQLLLNSYISVDYIRDVVCSYYNIPKHLLDNKTRKREIVQARQVAMYFSRNMTGLSLYNIGTKIGGKDHATVLHACKTVNNLIETDKTFKNQIRDMEVMLRWNTHT
jgi:chromosomal replication initiator protein